jgi:hypothetical protein
MILLAGLAGAATVYVNGVRADSLPEMSMRDVDVRVDAQGNIWIDAPRYKVEVVDGGVAAVAGGVVMTSPPVYPTTPAPPPAVVTSWTAAPSRVAAATWYLVTEDAGSAGDDVEVTVNGKSVCHVRSGEGQVLVDLAPWLLPGPNTVAFNPTPAGRPGGGPLTLSVGRALSSGGVLRMDSPPVRYGRKASDLPTGGAKQFTLHVN